MAKKLFTSNSSFRSEFYTLLHFICIDFCTTPKKFPFLLPQPIFSLANFSLLSKSLFIQFPIRKIKLMTFLGINRKLTKIRAKPVARGLNLTQNMWVRKHVYENEKFLLLLKTLLRCLPRKMHSCHIKTKGSVALLKMPTVACNKIRKSSMLQKYFFTLYRSEIQWLTRFPPLLHGIGRIIGQNCLTF